MKVKKIFLSLCLCLFYGLFFLNIKPYAKTRIPARYRAYHQAVISALKNKKTSVELYGKEKEILYYWNQLFPKEENFSYSGHDFQPIHSSGSDEEKVRYTISCDFYRYFLESKGNKKIIKRLKRKTKGMSKKDKVFYVNQYLVDHVSYYYGASGEQGRSAYSCLVQKKGVCEGYARAFALIMKKMGISCRLVSGWVSLGDGSSSYHMWNRVKIKKSWYYLDVTWNDTWWEPNAYLPSRRLWKDHRLE